MENYENTILYTVADIRRIMSIGKDLAYALMHSKSFPSCKIGNKYYITKENFDKWISSYTNKTFRLA